MEKGVFGFKLSTYAVLAIIFAFLGQTTLLALLLGFVIVTEKNEWLTRQVMQVFFLAIGLSIISTCLDAASGALAGLLGMIPLGFISLSGIVTTVFGFIDWGFGVAALVFLILALVKVLKGKEANIPLFAMFANKAYGAFKAAPQAQPQYPQYPQYPQQ